jgi:hypothetical protein
MNLMFLKNHLNHLNLMYLMYHLFLMSETIPKNLPNLKSHLNLMFH